MDKTDKQAVYDIAVKLGYTGDEGPSVASAIYAVAQAKGYEGACEGDASQALQALYTVVGGGGGGGDVGELVPLLFVEEPPVVDEGTHQTFNAMVYSVMTSDGKAICLPSSGCESVAAGVKAKAFISESTTATVYFVTTEDPGHGDIFKTVEPAGITPTITEGTGDEAGYYFATWTMPAAQEGKILCIYTPMGE